MTAIRLTEYGDRVEAALPDDVAAWLSTRKLLEMHRTAAAGVWSLRAISTVGSVRIGHGPSAVDITITPKVPIDRLVFLLGYARDPKGWQNREVELPQRSELFPAVATAFARQAERALRHGLLQGYRTVQEALPVLRGRLREHEQLRRRFGLMVPAEVEYDDYSADIAENRLLAAAARRLLRLPGLGAGVQGQLGRVLSRLDGVTPWVPGHPLPDWQSTRLNARYVTALHLAELVLRAGSFDLEPHTPDDVRPLQVDGFLFNMNIVFEDFVTTALREALRPYGGRSSAQDPQYLDVNSQVRMLPDLVWYGPDDRPCAIADAKYKAGKKGGFPDADLYQMLAYCTALSLRRGHLLYAAGNRTLTGHTVRQAGVEIVQHVLPLHLPPAELLRAMARIANALTADRTRAADIGLVFGQAVTVTELLAAMGPLGWSMCGPNGFEYTTGGSAFAENGPSTHSDIVGVLDSALAEGDHVSVFLHRDDGRRSGQLRFLSGAPEVSLILHDDRPLSPTHETSDTLTYMQELAPLLRPLGLTGFRVQDSSL
ncbi:McrC family protein [Streptomyces sp. NBC_00111]|uniref:McrC family protein n=1 Tax=Streptomyces sp. NBC_00111 TaxID=2975655 RepID=UPI00324758FD